MWQETLDFAKEHPELLFGAVGLWITITQYRKTQRWKSGEFVIAKFEAIQQNQYTGIIHEMLDWNESTLIIPYKGEDIPVHFTDEKLIWMLRPHKIDGTFSEDEIALRYAFDQYISELEQISYINQIGLLQMRDIKPHFGYWLDIMGRKKNGRKNERTIQAIHNYLFHYRQEGTLRLLRGAGFYGIRYNEAAAGYQKPG